MAAAADRVSALPDHVLQRVLALAPPKEAASTAALSRRWRPLWRRAAAVTLDTQPYAAAIEEASYSCHPSNPAEEDPAPFFLDADKVLAAFRPAAGAGLRKLSLSLDQPFYRGVKPHSYPFDSDDSEDEDEEEDRVGAAILAHPAMAGLEELRIECRPDNDRLYSPRLASLPCAAATLRVLELAHCDLRPPSSPAGQHQPLDLPNLTLLRLHLCVVSEGHLQTLADAAPKLADLALVNVIHKSPEKADPRFPPHVGHYAYRLRLRLRCPAVTALVLQAHASDYEPEPHGIELDMPSLCTFRYTGAPVKLSLSSPATGLERVYLDPTLSGHRFGEPVPRMLASFSGTRALRLWLYQISDMAAGDEHEGLPTLFPNLELLDLEVISSYVDDEDKAAVAMARMLGSCPAISELRLHMWGSAGYEESIKDPALRPFGLSMERFNRLASMPDFSVVSELAAFCGCTLSSCLRKVSLKFQSKKHNCFPVKLAKFIVENAVALEEMHVDDGNQFWPDHLHYKVARWRADSLRRRNLPDAGSFRVYKWGDVLVT